MIFQDLLDKYNNQIPVGMLIKTKDYDEIIDNDDPNAHSKPLKSKTILIGDCSLGGGTSNHCCIDPKTKVVETKLLKIDNIEWKYDLKDFDMSLFDEEEQMLSSTFLSYFIKAQKPGLVLQLDESSAGEPAKIIVVGHASQNGGLCDVSNIPESQKDVPVLWYGYLL